MERCDYCDKLEKELNDVSYKLHVYRTAYRKMHNKQKDDLPECYNVGCDWYMGDKEGKKTCRGDLGYCMKDHLGGC